MATAVAAGDELTKRRPASVCALVYLPFGACLASFLGLLAGALLPLFFPLALVWRLPLPVLEGLAPAWPLPLPRLDFLPRLGFAWPRLLPLRGGFLCPLSEAFNFLSRWPTVVHAFSFRTAAVWGTGLRLAWVLACLVLIS